ncbi:MAG: DnaB-like helicase C-terminal domain-containing protein [Bacteroidales bacterium]|jgi:hypothetical protein|nr:DnaB-like helicase C-terminal domain-containing protein [Bacteroidales bacterium]
MENNFPAVPESVEFTSLKEIVWQLLFSSGYLVDANATGIATGFDKIDALTSGFQTNELCVVASKPGSGKTAFLLSLLFNIASKSGKTVGVFSPERSAAKMFYRLIESQTRQSVKKITSGSLTDSEKEQIYSILFNLSQANILADDAQYINKDYFYRRCKQFKYKHNADIIFVDGFELLACDTLTDVDNNEDEQRRVLADINEISKELNIPIVVFSHLLNTNRLTDETLPAPFENVQSFVPQIADSLFLIYRSADNHTAKIVIGKHPKLQQPEIVTLKFIESIDRFVDFQETDK